MIYQLCVGVLVLLIFNVEKGHAIKCYSCSSKINDACYKPDLSALKPVHCNMKTLEETKNNSMTINKSYHNIFEVDPGSGVGENDLVCLKVEVKDGDMNTILRGCQLAEQRDLDICTRLEKSNTDMVRSVFCSKCNNEDGCNSSPRSFNFNGVLASMFAIICKVFYSL